MKLYAFATPNNLKPAIALEEMAIPYELIKIDIRAGEQKEEEFLALNPNGKVPVLVDSNGVNEKPFILTESAAILVYLAEKTNQLLPQPLVERARVFEQLFFHASALSPAYGQSGYFQKLAPEKIPAAIERFHSEALRVTKVLDSILERRPYVAGQEYTIADINHFGWLWRRNFAGINLESHKNITRWYEHIAERPAVKKAIEKISALNPT